MSDRIIEYHPCSQGQLEQIESTIIALVCLGWEQECMVSENKPSHFSSVLLSNEVFSDFARVSSLQSESWLFFNKVLTLHQVEETKFVALCDFINEKLWLVYCNIIQSRRKKEVACRVRAGKGKANTTGSTNGAVSSESNNSVSYKRRKKKEEPIESSDSSGTATGKRKANTTGSTNGAGSSESNSSVCNKRHKEKEEPTVSSDSSRTATLSSHIPPAVANTAHGTISSVPLIVATDRAV
jgi:hypothetical protein